MTEGRRSFALEDEEENIHVVVRIRPMQSNEKKNGDIPCVKGMSSGREVQVKVGPLEAQNYKCHRCFDPDTTQSDFFEDCGITDLLDSSIEGYRSCAFAFGQTGAGKTYTMVGASKGLNVRDKHVGLIGRSLEYLYTKLSSSEQPFRIKLSCLEIYHEHVYDLFAEEKDRTPLAIREHATEGFFLEGSRLVECKDYEIACNALEVAVKNRQVGGHELNSRSSRSHCVTEIHLEVLNKYHQGNEENDQIYTEMGVDDKAQYTTRGKMSLIDLAGSERLKNTNSTGKVLQEAGFINRSLYVLGKVIAGLVRTNGDLNHKDVPYRDSKLTKLLISSLGGNSRTLLIACVSEAKGSQAETLRTLKFSMSCARIRNKPVKFLDPQEKLIKELRDEIKRLKLENRKLRSTLLTAPAGEKSNYLSPGGNSNEEFHRALSAQPNMRPAPISNSPLKKKQILISSQKNSKKKQYSTRMKESKSDIFAKYPQLKNILKDEKKKQLISEDHRFRPSVYDSIESITKGDNSNKPKNGNPLLEENDNSYQQEDSPSRKISNEILDEMIHRRAPGPMIFKDKSPIQPLRDTRLKQYYPAENYVKTMDAKFDKDRNDSVSRDLLDVMEDSHANNMISQENGIKNHQIFLVEDQSSIHSSNISIDASEIIKKKQKKQKAPVKIQKPIKPSPYIAHLYQKGKPTETKNEKRNVKSISQLPNLPKAKQSQQLMGGKDSKINEQDQSSIYPVNPRNVDLHDSIMKELDELGLTPSKKIAPSSVKKLPDINKSSVSAYKAAIGSPKKPSSRSGHSPKKSKLPNLSINNKEQGNKPTPVKEQLSAAMFHHTKDREEEPELEIQFDSNFLPSFLPNIEIPAPVTQVEEAPSPEKLREKLVILEKSLRTKRMEMEDCPGDVTSEMEEKFRELQVQTKMLKLELTKLTGEVYVEDQEAYSPINKKKPKETDENYYEDEYGEDDFENDFEPIDDTANTKEEVKTDEIDKIENNCDQSSKKFEENTLQKQPLISVDGLKTEISLIDKSKFESNLENTSSTQNETKQEFSEKLITKSLPKTVDDPEEEQTYEDDNYEDEFEEEIHAASPMKLVQSNVQSLPNSLPPENFQYEIPISGKYQDREISISPLKNLIQPSLNPLETKERPSGIEDSNFSSKLENTSPSRLPPAPIVHQHDIELTQQSIIDDFEAEYGDEEFYDIDD